MNNATTIRSFAIVAVVALLYTASLIYRNAQHDRAMKQVDRVTDRVVQQIDENAHRQAAPSHHMADCLAAAGTDTVKIAACRPE